MEQEIKNRLEAQEVKIDAIYQSVEKTKKYFLIIMWVGIIAFVLPLIGLGLALPAFINSYVGQIDILAN